MQTIAIVNEKGGSGKTTTSVNLAAALGREGLNVLLVDLDGQAASTRWLGLEDDTRFADALWAGTGLEPIEAVLPGVDLAPGHGKLDSVAHDLRPTQGGQLRKLLSELDGRYDLAMIDCPPSLGNRLIGNALMAATHALVPVETSILAMDCMKSLLETIEDVREGLGHDIKLMGILPCRYDGRTNLSRSVVGELRRVLPGKVLNTVIRENVRLRECPASGMCIFDYAPSSNGSEDYQSLARELVSIRNGTWTPVDPDADWREVSELCKARTSSQTKRPAGEQRQSDAPDPANAETPGEQPGEAKLEDPPVQEPAQAEPIAETTDPTPAEDDATPDKGEPEGAAIAPATEAIDPPPAQAPPIGPTDDADAAKWADETPQPEATAPIEVEGEPENARDTDVVIEDDEAPDLAGAETPEVASNDDAGLAETVPSRPALTPEQAKEALKTLTGQGSGDGGPTFQAASLDSTDGEATEIEPPEATASPEAGPTAQAPVEVDTETIDGDGQVVVTLDDEPPAGQDADAPPLAEPQADPTPETAIDTSLDDVVITIDEGPASDDAPDPSTSADAADPREATPADPSAESQDAAPTGEDPPAGGAIPLTWDDVVSPADSHDEQTETPPQDAQAAQAAPAVEKDAPAPVESAEAPAGPAMEWDPDDVSVEPDPQQAPADGPSARDAADDEAPHTPPSLEPSLDGADLDAVDFDADATETPDGSAESAEQAHDADATQDAGDEPEDQAGDREPATQAPAGPPPGTWPTPESEFYRPILEALATLGGTSKEDEVLRLVGESMPLNDADRAPAPGGGDMPVWKTTAQKAKRLLTIDGLMKEQRFRRIWKITSRGKSALNDAQHKRIYD